MFAIINRGTKCDLGTLDDVGIYQAADVVNGPVGVVDHVFVHVTSANVGGVHTVVQQLWDLTAATGYTRVKRTGGWTEWVANNSGGGGGDGDYDPLGTADAVMADHLADADPHPQYLNEARGDARYDATGTAAAAVAAHEAADDPHPQYLTPAEASTAYDAAGTADDAVSAHVGEADPHTQYLKESDAATTYEAKGTSDAGISAHVAAVDPHTQYLKETDAETLYEAAGTADAAVAAHVGESDPHTQYFDLTRGDGRYYPRAEANSLLDAKVAKSGDTMTGRLNVPFFTYGRAIDVSSTDLNDLNVAGFYNGSALTNSPDGSASWFYIEVYKHVNGDSYVRQEASALSPGGKKWVRWCISGTWGSWAEIWTDLGGSVFDRMGYTPINPAGGTMTGIFGVGNGLIRSYNSTGNADIAALTGGSTSGTLFQGATSAHTVIGISGNDTGDGFHVVGKVASADPTAQLYTISMLKVTQAAFQYMGKNILYGYTVSTSAPSGGDDGDFWFQREA